MAAPHPAYPTESCAEGGHGAPSLITASGPRCWGQQYTTSARRSYRCGRGGEGASGFQADSQGSGGYRGPHGASSRLDLPASGPARPCGVGRRWHWIQALNLSEEAACTETTGPLHALHPIYKLAWELIKMTVLEEARRI